MSTSISNILSDRSINATCPTGTAQESHAAAKTDLKSMEHHRQMLQAKLEESRGNQTYVSPSDTIMSPCTAKLSSYRSKQIGKAKPKSLFAKTSSKNLGAGPMFGDKAVEGTTNEEMGGR